MAEKCGIAVAGSILVDKIKGISAYPECGQLVQIKSMEKAVGGLVPNVGVDLKKIDPALPVFAYGKIGADEEGEYIVDVLSSNGVDCENIIRDENEATSYTDVMSVIGGQRTFFTYPGTSSTYGFEDIDFEGMNAKILHLGYFLLLDKIDGGDGEKILKAAQDAGVKTSIDLVSENSDRYNLVLPCLKYTDYLIINELEAAKMAGMEPEAENLEAIARKLMGMGVKEKVIIHMKDRGVCLSKDGFTLMPAYAASKEYIKGKTGAGDAFCAGALYGIYNEFSDYDILDTASMAAVASLRTADATSGVVSLDELKKLCDNLGREEI